MKQHALALLIQPYRNRLMEQTQLRGYANGYVSGLIELLKGHPGICLNLSLPGSILELVDPLKLTTLRELNQHGTIEWLVCGYTEPFISLSPSWLTRENIRTGIETISHLLNITPAGYAPPFSNWEPHLVGIFRELGFQYLTLSSSLFAPNFRHLAGCWSTEHLGLSIVLYPLHTLHPFNAPADARTWLENQYQLDTVSTTPVKMLGIRYLLPLEQCTCGDSFVWLHNTLTMLEERAQEYQTVCFSTYLSDHTPLGMQYLVSGMQDDDGNEHPLSSFRNRLFAHDQVGIIHRKMLEICDMLERQENTRFVQGAAKKLFFVQDINRFLPARASGFTHVDDRCWCFRRLIEIEESLRKAAASRGAQARITDYLRNGRKNIILSNRNLTVGIDHHLGGGVFELDFVPRGHNIVSVYLPRPCALPRIIAAESSRLCFGDHLLPPGTTHGEFSGRAQLELGDFYGGRYEPSIKKTGTDVKVILTRHGAIRQGERNCPLTIEKVFSLDKSDGTLSFVYQLTNSSVLTYDALFAVELVLVFPGAQQGLATIRTGGREYRDMTSRECSFDNVTSLTVDDTLIGLSLTVNTQKAVTLWLRPVCDELDSQTRYQGNSLVLCTPIQLGESASWKLMGTLQMRKCRRANRNSDAF